MKKVLLIAVCAVLSLAASAQRATSSSYTFFSTEKADQPITFGVRVGGNLSTMTGDIDEIKSRFGFNVGVNVDIPLLQSLYLQTGLYASQKGFKCEDCDENTNPLYLEIPILASYRYNFSDATQLQVNFGPYMAYGISGKMKHSGDDPSEVDIFDGVAKKFDAGLQIGAGVTVSKFYIGCAYQFGLANISDIDDVDMKNSNFMFNIGYNF